RTLPPPARCSWTKHPSETSSRSREVPAGSTAPPGCWASRPTTISRAATATCIWLIAGKEEFSQKTCCSKTSSSENAFRRRQGEVDVRVGVRGRDVPAAIVQQQDAFVQHADGEVAVT